MSPWTPSVSVVIPTRDRPQLLQRALDSAIGQDYDGDIEVLVVFDRQEPTLTDREYRPGRRLKVLTNVRAANAAGTRNSGIAAAEGELVAFCDDDDVWLPGKLRAQVELLTRHSEAVGCCTGIYIQYRDTQTERRPPQEVTTHRDMLRSRVAELHPSTAVFRRSSLMGEVGLVDEELPGSYAEDYDLMLRATRQGPIVAVCDPLVRVYWHDGSWFTGDWTTIIAAINHMLVKHPDFYEEPVGLSRLFGRLAFAHAALGQRSSARSYALRTMRLNPREKRAYISLAVSTGVLPSKVAMRVANLAGKAI